MTFRKILAVACLFPFAAVAADLPPADALIPLKDFARLSDWSNVKISPNGEYLGATLFAGKDKALAIFRITDLKMTGALRFAGGQSIGDYWWVGPDRIVASLVESVGFMAQPRYLGEMWGISANGKGRQQLASFRDKNTLGTRLGGPAPLRGWPSMIDPLPKDPRHALLQVEYWYEAMTYGDSESSVVMLDVTNGNRTNITHAPFRGPSYYLTDHRAQVRYVAGLNVENVNVAYSRAPDSEAWTPLKTDALAKARIWPLSFAADDKKVYLKSDEGGDRYCLIEHVLESDTRSKLACHDEADLDETLFSFDGGHPIGAVFAPDKPTVQWLDPSDPDAKHLRSFASNFPGQVVMPVSATDDGQQVVLLVYSDRNPGDFYLFNVATKKARFLVPRNSWIDPSRQAEVRPISFKARDGTKLFGYLTLPPGRDPRGLPLVMFPHGGPVGIRDNWEWDSDTQVLASRGYAVLQVNYRGSRGYGRAFRNAGTKAWGTGMIDDITDAVKFAVAQGYADPKRLCIFGGSYGGYAALMSAVREPDLYQCAIGYAGVYDLKMLKAETVYTEHERGINWFEDMVAGSEQEMVAQSPLTYIDKLKAPVLIMHGTEDKIVPISQAKALRAALEKGKHPYEWLIETGEGHGFYEIDAREEAYAKVLAFLDAHIGPGARPAAPPAH